MQTGPDDGVKHAEYKPNVLQSFQIYFKNTQRKKSRATNNENLQFKSVRWLFDQVNWYQPLLYRQTNDFWRSYAHRSRFVFHDKRGFSL